jgi:hypothetical protein
MIVKADILYKVSNIPHPFDKAQRGGGVTAWCLVKVIKPKLGPELEEPVAIFNFNSEAELFMSHVFLAGLHDCLVKIDETMMEIFERKINR